MRGGHSLCKSRASWKAMVKALQNEGERYFVEYHYGAEQEVDGQKPLSSFSQKIYCLVLMIFSQKQKGCHQKGTRIMQSY